jgi:hypothetical protein
VSYQHQERKSVRTIIHRSVLFQRGIQRVVHMVWVGDDVFLVRDLRQALGSSRMSDPRVFLTREQRDLRFIKERHTLTALIHSALSPRESARHSRRTCGFTQRLPWERLVTLFESPESDGEAATRENHPRNRLKTVPLLVSRIDVYEQRVTCGEVWWDDTAAKAQTAEAGNGWVERRIGHGHICLYTEPISADV